jgi:hypothetical protein
MRFFLTLSLCCVLFANLAVAAATAPPALLAATAAAVPAAEAQAWVDSVLARPPLPAAAAAPPRAPEQEQPVLATADTPRPQVTAAQTIPQTVKKNGRAGKDRRNSETAVTRQAAQAPPLVAAPAAATTTAQPSSFWLNLFTPAATGEETALPPLRAGVQPAEPPKPAQEEPVRIESVLIKRFTQQEAAGPLPTSSSDTEAMLASLVELQKNIRQEIKVTRKRLKASSSEAEKVSLEEELKQLDQQLSDSVADFERIATGVEPTVFIPQEDKGFSWKDELTTLLEPTVKELKQLTARARQKTQLKEEILELGKQAATANRAVTQLNTLIATSNDASIKTYLHELLPAWQNMHKRIQGKLDLARLELAKLEDENGGAARSPTEYIKTFFRERGLYLFTAVLAFAGTLVLCRLFNLLLLRILPGARRDQRPLYVRVFQILFSAFTAAAAVGSFVFVLYLAEDWFLLSLALILLLGVAWAVRQVVPKLWQQSLLMLNLGPVHEGERVIYQDLPWQVEALNVFAKLHNPALGLTLRVPVDRLIGQVSRPFTRDEPWFPCRRDDWVLIEGKPLAKVVSCTHEQVEVVEMGGRRIVYRTGDFLAATPINLSSGFNISVVFGLSYDLQPIITSEVLAKLETFLQRKMEEHGYMEGCHSLSVDFKTAGASSLDVAVLSTFKGNMVPDYYRLERALNKWCVDCCNENGWEIPFPQLTVHHQGAQPA